jgi:hypothetical protein
MYSLTFLYQKSSLFILSHRTARLKRYQMSTLLRPNIWYNGNWQNGTQNNRL